MKPLSPAAALVLHLAILAVLGPLALLNNRVAMFNGLDGEYVRTLIAQQYDWMPLGLALSMNPLQGLGNVFFPTNFGLVPALLIQLPWAGGHIDPLLGYTLFAIELFIAGYLAARVLDLPSSAAIAGAWILTLVAFPLLPAPRLYAIFGLTPHVVDLVLGLVLVLWALRKVAERDGPQRWIALAILAVLPALLVAQNPLLVMIVALAATAWTVGIVAMEVSPHMVKWRLLGLACAFLVLGAGGFAGFLAGSTLYTVPTFFSPELFQVQNIMHNASIAFQGHLLKRNGTGAHLVVLATAGALVALHADRECQRWFAKVHLALTIVVLAGGWYLVRHAHNWRGPQMIYFEIAVWPFYAAYAGYFLFIAWHYIAGALRRSTAYRLPQLARLSGPPLLVSAVLSYGAAAGAPEPTRVFPPNRTPIVERLQQEIGLEPGNVFRGSAATFTGAGVEGKPVSWFDLAVFDRNLEYSTGNDHRFVGLWHYRIPTLQEYSQYITPPSYLVLSRLLARPHDRQIRNVTLLTRPREDLLEALGVRFVVSDSVWSGRARLILSQDSGEGVTLHLYELPRPNVGHLSPIRNIRVATAAEALGAIAKADLRQEVVTTESLPANLVSARDAQMRFSSDGARIIARSDGISVLLLPLQFSRCLTVRGPSMNEARIFRANLFQTAVLFESKLDLTLRLRVGPLRGANCRLEDFNEMRRFRLTDAMRAQPLRRTSEAR